MAQRNAYYTNELLWGETFYTDRRLSIISNISMPGMVEDEVSEASSEDDYHLPSVKPSDTCHNEQSLRAASTLLTQVNRTYARDNHQYPNFAPIRPTRNHSTRRKSNVLKTLQASSPDHRRPTDRAYYGTWPLRHDSSQQLPARRPSSERYSSEPHALGPYYGAGRRSILEASAVLEVPPSNAAEATRHEHSYFEYSDDEDDGIKGLTGKAMKRLHMRSSSATKVGQIKGGSLRRFFRSKRL